MRIDNNKIKNGKKTYMWVYRNRQTEETRPIVLFDWQPSRKADHPRDFLKNFSGTVITDGYQVYHKLSRERDDLPTIDRLKQRQLILIEKVDAYFAWVKLKYTQVSHNSTIGKALAYSIHQESYLRTFLNDGGVPMDNNYAEQAIRPFTIGRKNFVLIESSNGARASAMIYSIVETAKANYLNVYQYFELLLTEIPKRMNDTDLKFIGELLPWAPRVQETCPSRFKKS
ncbi:IS66 family transposase [[Ruminococcus] torques]|uniref:IS66 family transposase n=1 Tax=[Ruminococcus] torques TaxID=33039 RepID=UPI003078DD1C